MMLADELRKVLEEVAERIAKQAVELSLHAGRKTIKPEDIRFASQECDQTLVRPGLYLELPM